MKRLILLMCAGLLVVACEQEASYRERSEARATFAEAQQVLEQAVAGGASQQAREDEEYTPMHVYRRQQFQAAANMLQPMANSAVSSERIAARSLLAEAAITHGNAVVDEASANWSRLIANHSRLLSTIGALSDAQAAQVEYAAVDLDPQLAEIQQDQQELEAQRQEVEQRIAAIEQRIAEFQAEVDEAEGQRRDVDRRASELSSEAFQAEGEEQFDLYVQVSDLQEESGALSSRIELAEGQIDTERSQLGIEQVYLGQIDEQLAQLAEAAEALEERSAMFAELSHEAGDEFGSLAEHFEQVLDEIIAAHQEQVEDVISEAYGYFDDAVQHLQGATQAATGNERDILRLQVESARSGYGRAYAEAAMMRQSYQNLLLSVAEAVSEILPEHAASMGELAAELSEWAEEAAAEAEQMLGEAHETLAEMVEPAGARGNTAQHRALLQQLIVINNRLASLTNNAAYSDQAAEFRGQLDAL